MTSIYNIASRITLYIYIDSIKFIVCKTLNLKTTRLNHLMDFRSIQTTNATTNSNLAQLALNHNCHTLDRHILDRLTLDRHTLDRHLLDHRMLDHHPS